MTATAPPKNNLPAPIAKASPLAVMGARYSIEPGKLLDVLKGTVIKSTDKHQATNEEVAAFVIVANEYKLNPFTREIHAFVGQGGAIVPIVGVDGWARLVNSHPDFDGVDFSYEQDGEDVGVSCAIHVKGKSRPVQITEWLRECKKNTIPWNTMPRRMLRHRAYIQCARLAFGFSGIYDEDEGKDIVRQINAGIVQDAPRPLPTGRNRIGNRLPSPTPPDAANGKQEDAQTLQEALAEGEVPNADFLATQEQLDRIDFLSNERKVTSAGMKKLLEAASATSLTQMTKAQADNIISNLEETSAV
jgi:phage recombination protein Bet